MDIRSHTIKQMMWNPRERVDLPSLYKGRQGGERSRGSSSEVQTPGSKSWAGATMWTVQPPKLASGGGRGFGMRIRMPRGLWRDPTRGLEGGWQGGLESRASGVEGSRDEWGR